jgi:transmembrane sensor
MRETGRIAELIFKYLKDELNTSEAAELEVWKQESAGNQKEFDELIDPDKIRDDLKEIYSHEDAVWSKLIAKAPELDIKQKDKNNLALWIAAAAIFILTSGVCWYIFKTKNNQPQNELVIKNPDIPPGGNHATLQIAGSKYILLDTVKQGLLSENKNIIKEDSGQIVYTASADKKNITENILSIPRGGQYKVVLSDGTKVWLNAASSLTYPSSFSGNERKVVLTGEAYFEVTKNPSIPFRVLLENKSFVEVLGTHFDVMSYSDEPYASATLLEGKIKIGDIILKPGEQSRMSADGKIKMIKDIDTTAVIAWKNGMTSFSNADIKTILRIISRWYNVDVEYTGSIPDKEFAGAIPRNSKLSEVFKVLELNGIHFKTVGRKIIVSP